MREDVTDVTSSLIGKDLANHDINGLAQDRGYDISSMYLTLCRSVSTFCESRRMGRPLIFFCSSSM